MLLVYMWFHGWPLDNQLYNQLGGYSLGKTVSPTLSVLWLSVCLGLGPCEYFPIHVPWLLVVFLFQSCLDEQCCWDVMGIAFLTFLGDTTSQNPACFPDSYNSVSVPIPPCFLSLRCRNCAVGQCVSVGSGNYMSACLLVVFWLVVLLCTHLCLWLRDVSLMMGEDSTSLKE